MYQFILASESPRRRQILESAGFVFSVHPVKVSEIPNKNLNIDQQILDIAGRKARAAFDSLNAFSAQPFILLAADTMVVYQDEALGKPENEREAEVFLKRLSGRTHFVKTALVLIRGPKTGADLELVSHIETSEVRFHTLSESEIRSYIQSGEPMDKAGAYAIQGEGRKFVESFTGDYENIVGLPLAALKLVLQQNHWQMQRRQEI